MGWAKYYEDNCRANEERWAVKKSTIEIPIEQSWTRKKEAASNPFAMTMRHLNETGSSHTYSVVS